MVVEATFLLFSYSVIALVREEIRVNGHVGNVFRAEQPCCTELAVNTDYDGGFGLLSSFFLNEAESVKRREKTLLRTNAVRIYISIGRLVLPMKHDICSLNDELFCRSSIISISQGKEG